MCSGSNKKILLLFKCKEMLKVGSQWSKMSKDLNETLSKLFLKTFSFSAQKM